MEKKYVSIITIVYNDVINIENTIKSVIDQDYKNKEFLVIDGGSNDGTVDIIKKYSDFIDYWSSESDNGIYDAMNKGLSKASGEWINFMNSGDIFANTKVLSTIFRDDIDAQIKFLYSDYYELYKGKRILRKASIEKGVILHQSCIYRKDLHNSFGIYISFKKEIIADYLFFCSIPPQYFRKVETIISCNQLGGVSRGLWCGIQWLCAQVIFNNWSFNKIILEYYKRILKKALVNFHLLRFK